MIRIAINGFGRIGRNLFRLLLNHPNIEVIAINDIADKKTMAHLVKYDSIHGVLPQAVSNDEKGILVDGNHFLFFHEKNISNLDWKSLDIDYVVESTGKYKTFEELNSHIIAGAKKVILSAPSEIDTIKTVVLGVNDFILDGTETIISNASCTTNNAAPMIKVINELCGIEQAYITTIHSTKFNPYKSPLFKYFRYINNLGFVHLILIYGAIYIMFFYPLHFNSSFKMNVYQVYITTISCFIFCILVLIRIIPQFFSFSEQEYKSKTKNEVKDDLDIDVSKENQILKDILIKNGRKELKGIIKNKDFNSLIVNMPDNKSEAFFVICIEIKSKNVFEIVNSLQKYSYNFFLEL